MFILKITKRTFSETTLLGFAQIVLTLIFLGPGNLKAQSGTVAFGGNATGSGGSISYSIGQVDYINATGEACSISQGIQQPIQRIQINKPTEIDFQALLYPNPTADFAILSTPTELKKLSYSLIDLNGKLISQEKINSNQVRIPMSKLANGTYFIKIIKGVKEIKTFKIIKSN